MNISKIWKAIAAGLGGGAVAGTGAATGMFTLPEGSPPIYYVLMAAVAVLGPALATYIAPKNAE